MTKILCAIFSAVLLAGIALAQATPPPASGSTPGSQPEPSSAQPPSQQQVPESQQTPQRQPTDQPPAASRQVPTQYAGQTRAAANPPSSALKIAPGSVIPAQLTKGVDAKKAKTGDEVVAKVTQDMKTSNGEVLVPKDTKLVGHITEAQARTKEQKESQVGITFDRAVMKNGGEMQLPMSIQAIIGQQNNPNAPGGNDQTSSGGGYSPGGGSGGASAGGPGRTPGIGGSSQQPTPPPSTGSSNASDSQTGTATGPITAQTQGVVGISNLKLSTAPNASQGSVVSSDKNNVKLDSGTLLLLKVNQQQ